MGPLPPYLARHNLRISLREVMELISEAEAQLARLRTTAERLEQWVETESTEDDTVKTSPS